MMRVAKKVLTYEATQWFKDGDHPHVRRMPNRYDIGVVPIQGGLGTVHIGDWIVEDDHGHREVCPNEFFEKYYESA